MDGDLELRLSGLHQGDPIVVEIFEIQQGWDGDEYLSYKLIDWRVFFKDSDDQPSDEIQDLYYETILAACKKWLEDKGIEKD